MKIGKLSGMGCLRLGLVLIGLAGCAGPRGGVPAALLLQVPTAEVQPTVFTMPATFTPQPSPSPLPTYTRAPTFTPVPTFTPWPTQTPTATFTPAPMIQSPSSGAPVSAHTYTLRIHNASIRAVLWIGVDPPYAGGFIKPLWYVEFYAAQPTLMRVTWCVPVWKNLTGESYSSAWYVDWNKNWDDPEHYACASREVFVDKGVTEIGVE